MIRVIALTQFAFTAIGALAVIVLSRAQTIPGAVGGGLRALIELHVLWMLLIPVVWMFAAGFAVRRSDKPSVEKMAQVSGVALALLLASVFVWLILSY